MQRSPFNCMAKQIQLIKATKEFHVFELFMCYNNLCCITGVRRDGEIPAFIACSTKNKTTKLHDASKNMLTFSRWKIEMNTAAYLTGRFQK